MLKGVLNMLRIVFGLILDILTLPFRLIAALLGGVKFEFRRFSGRTGRTAA